MADVTIVDENDQVLGRAEYRDARRDGRFHRITQVLVMNSAKEILLQLRSQTVHEAPGTWDVSAGGHVDPDQSYLQAAQTEAREEIGMEGVEFVELGKHLSETRDAQEWVRRFNMVYLARYDGKIHPELDEVDDVKWIDIARLGEWIRQSPEDFAPELRWVYELYLAPMLVQS